MDRFGSILSIVGPDGPQDRSSSSGGVLVSGWGSYWFGVGVGAEGLITNQRENKDKPK